MLFGKVGSGAKIASNAVVLEAVPENATAVGVPARVVRINGEKVKEALDHVHIPDPVAQEICRVERRVWELENKLKQYEEREKRERASKAKRDEAQRFYNALAKQEQEMAKKYEGFNLEKELQDDRFKAMLKANVPMEDAYFAAHRSEMLKKTVAEAKNATLQSVAAKGTRPAETASSASAPTTAQVDYSKLSRRDFMKIWNS